MFCKLFEPLLKRPLKKRGKITLYLVFVLLANVGSCDFLVNPGEVPNGLDWKNDAFLVPNETHTHLAKGPYSQVKPGIFVSVGTERGFFPAAATEANTYYWLIILRPPKI